MKPSALIAHVGSLRGTLGWIVLLALVVLAGSLGSWVASSGWAMLLGLVFAALALNLLAALVVHPAFRRQLPLLVAHLALLALLVLVGLGRLTSLDGRFELTEGLAFDGQLLDARRGPWHHDGLQRLAFRQEGFEIDYAPGLKRGATRNRVAWVDDDGVPQRAVIGDHHPLRLAGYRVYTSPNKGFAPVLRWLPERGEPMAGAVHLPSYPANALRQSREWTLPDGRSAWVQLAFDETLIDPDRRSRFRLPEAHRLVLRIGTQRAELAPGGRLAVGGGTIVYDGLRTWMGYRVSHDPTLPWLLAAALLAALSLAWHYFCKFRAAGRGAVVLPAAVTAAGGARDA